MGRNGNRSAEQKRVVASTMTVGALATSGTALMYAQPDTAPPPRTLTASVTLVDHSVLERPDRRRPLVRRDGGDGASPGGQGGEGGTASGGGDNTDGADGSDG
jgi:hypothetical protein